MLRRLWTWLFPWRRDPRNPARRYCKTCGQQQDYWFTNIYGLGSPRNPGAWESTYPAAPCAARIHDLPRED